MSAYLDASVLLARLVREAMASDVDLFMAGWTDRRIVSEFAAVEVASGLSRLARMGLLTETDAHLRLADFDRWRLERTDDVDLEPADVRLAAHFVRRFELALRGPDALHLAVARRTRARLVTLDRRLALAARTLGVPAIVPGET